MADKSELWREIWENFNRLTNINGSDQNATEK